MKNKIILLLVALIITLTTSIIRGFPLQFLKPAVCIQMIGSNCPPFIFNWPNLFMNFIFWIVIVGIIGSFYIQKIKTDKR